MVAQSLWASPINDRSNLRTKPGKGADVQYSLDGHKPEAALHGDLTRLFGKKVDEMTPSEIWLYLGGW